MPSCRRLHQVAYAARVDEDIDPYKFPPHLWGRLSAARRYQVAYAARVDEDIAPYKFPPPL